MNEPPTVDSNQPSSKELKVPNNRYVTWVGLLSILGGFFGFIMMMLSSSLNNHKDYMNSRLSGQREYMIHRDVMVHEQMQALREEICSDLTSIRNELDAVHNTTGECDEDCIGLGQTGLVNFTDSRQRTESGPSEHN